MRHRMPFLTVFLGLMMVFGMVETGHAQGPTDAFTLQPGGSATITFDSFCLDYGLLFPNTVGLPQAAAVDPNVIGVLNYAIGKGYTASQPEQVQLAIWKARGAPGVPDLDTMGQEMTTNLMQPGAPAGATSVLDAIANNQVAASVASFASSSARLSFIDDAFQGKGQLRVENTSGRPLTLYMPVGAYFPAPAAGYQNMIGYAAGIEVAKSAQAPAAAAAPTSTPEAPTNTPMPATATPLPATATPVPTNTLAPTATTAPTSTVAPTSTSGAPTVTPAQPFAPTPTSTGAIAGAGFEITPTAQLAPQMMPDTGVDFQMFSPTQLFTAVFLGLDVLALGYVLRRRARRR